MSQKNYKDFYKNFKQDELNTHLYQAAFTGDVELACFLLSSPDLKIHADIHYGNDCCFLVACKDGALGIIKLLVSLVELDSTGRPNLLNIMDEGMRHAVSRDHLDIVIYLNSINQDNYYEVDYEYCFNIAVSHQDMPLIEYFLFDFNLPVTDELITHVSRYINKEKMPLIIELMEKKKLFDEMNEQLQDKPIQSKTNKI